eukprot:GHUV01051619.1.p1 GENE.GHUV01051619.1~~GHUV01051619.1.p1  ORF type:complete len:107 (+),score=14.18 GHUV01051619.1:171-491(+)
MLYRSVMFPGIGPNMLLARIATKTAKPNGQALIRPDQARQFLADLEVDQLPGVGWSMRGKLADMGITRVRQVRFLLVITVSCSVVTELMSSAPCPYSFVIEVLNVH